jgi:MinD-like ATPase involved in chromosome partitioning or flagellar assembly
VAAPLPHSRRLTLVGAHHHSGRATATMVLGSLLAAVRGDPVLAVDGAPDHGSLHAFLPHRRRPALRDLAALPDGPSYEEISALTTRLPSGLEVATHRPGRFNPSPAHAQDYARVLAHTAPYYSVVLTDWAPRELGPQAAAVLLHTDRLILCCGTGATSLEATARTLRTLRHEAGELAGAALVVATDIEGGSGSDHRLAQRLGLPDHRVVRVPSDHALQTRDWTLPRLRAATVEAYLRLASLALEPAPD